MSSDRGATRQNTKKGDVIYIIRDSGIREYWEVLSENLQEPRVDLKKVRGKGVFGHLEGSISHTYFNSIWFHSIKKRYVTELE